MDAATAKLCASFHESDGLMKPFVQVSEFLMSQADGAVVADVGCGNGKYMAVNDKLWVYGSDRFVVSMQCTGDRPV